MADGRRYAIVLDAFLARSRAVGERAVAGARVIILALLVSRVVLGHFEHTVRQFMLIGMLLLTVVVAIVIRRIVKTTGPGRHTVLIGFSVATDSAILLVALLTVTIWAPPGYTGIIQSPLSGFTLLGVTLSVMRFSVVLTAWAVGINGVILCGLEWLDANVYHRPLTNESLFTVATLYISTSIFSLIVVRRARSLILEGAQAVLDAERATHHLGAYVSTEVAERALSGDELALGGHRQRVVCLFSDLRGFTAYSESLPPEQLVGEVNDYLEAMVAAATSEGGVIDKYIGDAIMVVFGTGTPRPDDAACAIRTARAMQRAMAQHNRDREARGLPALAQGIGIHGGTAVVGNVGTKARMQHTVMGSVVNIASRLEAATKQLDVPVLVSAEVVDEARESEVSLPTLRALPPMHIRGLSAPLEVFTFASDGVMPSLESHPSLT